MIRMTSELIEALDERAAELGLSRSQAGRQLIEAGLKAKGGKQ
jgi:ribbon-helix-helix CopG family protein